VRGGYQPTGCGSGLSSKVPDQAVVNVEIRATDFAFTLAVDVQRAPISSRYFLQDVDTGVLDGSSIFRIVTLQNQPATVPAAIEVVQMGLCERDPDIPVTIEHEPTRQTGLRHLRGTVSLARFMPGAVYHSFFVCMRDEPALDQGGARNPDGLGFAAFGQVVRGFEDLRRLFLEHARAGRGEYLDTPIGLKSFRRATAAF
jgi:peptidyl-prolyl cis-trans isomerase A (cyclophilin A)